VVSFKFRAGNGWCCLIQALLEKAENWDEAKTKMKDYRERSKDKLTAGNIKSREELHQLAMDDCNSAVALVDAKCSADDALAYKEWALKIANNVAAAASEGGFLGFGGEKISPEEGIVSGLYWPPPFKP